MRPSPEPLYNVNMRCDMHVHTLHSGLCNIPVLKAFCRESYSRPEEVYSALDLQGMGLVTITDHDSIDAAEALRGRRGFFVSEEVSCTLPSGSEMHVGVYDIDDRQHIEIQRRRDDFDALLHYLREQRLFCTANHIFSSLTGSRVLEDFAHFAAFDAVETMNGCMLSVSNRLAAEFADRMGQAKVGGSDAHVLHRVGACWTEVPGARDKAEFFAGLRRRRSVTHGRHGNYARLTRDILHIGISMVQTTPFSAPVAMLGGFAPVVTLLNYLRELHFSRVWARRLDARPAFPAAVREVAA